MENNTLIISVSSIMWHIGRCFLYFDIFHVVAQLCIRSLLILFERIFFVINFLSFLFFLIFYVFLSMVLFLLVIIFYNIFFILIFIFYIYFLWKIFLLNFHEYFNNFFYFSHSPEYQTRILFSNRVPCYFIVQLLKLNCFHKLLVRFIKYNSK